ncbi:TIGR00341 family protein [Halopelagius fulvigenes]|uniref:TIGR00341 family protein n=1 Tax=Halopelagius fulvigenes TaxID=1198324 RepID=A0ABD5TYY0_9EURY
MRLVQVMVPTGKRQAVVGVLEEEGIDYALSTESSNRQYAAVVAFPIPKAAVEHILNRLRDVGIERDSYIVVTQAETVVSRRFDELQEEWEEENPEGSDRIAREELVARAEEMAPRTLTFVVMTIISAIVATAGVLLDSPAVVVGSMVIAPLVGPAMTTSVGTIIDDREMFVRGAKLQTSGILLGIVSAALFALILRTTNIVPLTGQEVFSIGEVESRLSPDVLSLVVALGAGAAGAFSLASGVSAALVGVMIAAALVPPMAVVGIGLAWGSPVAVLGSIVLVLVNVLSINVVALVVLWRLGYRPKLWVQENEARSIMMTRVTTFSVILLILTAVLGAATYGSIRSAEFENDARAAIEASLPPDASLISMEVGYRSFPLLTPERITITIGYPPGEPPPQVADEISRKLNAQVPDTLEPWREEGIQVEVRYIAIQRPGGAGDATTSRDQDGGPERPAVSAAGVGPGSLAA